MSMLRQLWNDQTGFIVSAELVLVLTIGVLTMVVGLHAVSRSINHELSDISGAVGTMNQTYWYDGFLKPSRFYGSHAFVAGSGFGPDARDDCDCAEIVEIVPPRKLDVGDGRGMSEAASNL